jgi:CTP:molybdopterin cytidylyltransferase MocA
VGDLPGQHDDADHAGRPSRSVAGLLLAAGAGRRLGRPKALVEFRGRRLLERGIATLLDGGCAPVHVVLGAAYDEVVGLADLSAATVVHNADWSSGMGSSLRFGLASLPDTAAAVVVALVDQPLVSAAAVRRLREAYGRGAVAAVATYADKPRNPVLLDRELWSGVAELAQGDVGARAFLQAHPELMTPVPCDDVSAPDDLDTEADLHQLRAREID